MAQSLRVGLVGGLGPESTMDYYRRIFDRWKQRHSSGAPAVVVDSLDVDHALSLVATDRPRLVEYLADSVARLERAGADFAAITANTPHIVFDELQERSPIPLVSIVLTCCNVAQLRGLGRLALLGTRFTMEAAFYPAAFASKGMAIVIPEATERAWLHERT